MAEASIIRSGLTLTVIAAICTALVALTYSVTRERIDANERAWLEQSLTPALSGLFFDNAVTESPITIPAPHELPGSQDAVIYRVYSAGEPVAALFVVSARDGYSGAIRLLVGVDVNGIVTGVHVLAHRETPGLGDRIERTKSDWLDRFDGKSLGAPAAQGWKIRRDGGEFDQLTGASVTSRAVVKAIRQTLEYFATSKEAIFAAQAPDAVAVEQ